MISASVSSSNKTEAWLKSVVAYDPTPVLVKYAKEGVNALRSATPVDEGTTAAAWTYSIVRDAGKVSIIWENTNVVDGTPIAILIQYGHATGTGGYVKGNDYINPALKPIFDKISDELGKVVTRL